MIDALPLRRIYMDTNAFIEAFEGRRPVSALVASLFTLEPTSERPLLVTSQLTLAELLVKPLELNRPDLVRIYDNWTISNPYIEAVPIVRDVLADAAHLRSRDKTLKLADAIHLATALGTGCSHFLSNDTGIRSAALVLVGFSESNVADLLQLARSRAR